MTVPLIVLAFMSFIAGFGFFARRFLPLPEHEAVNFLVPLLAVTALLLGGGLAFYLYRNRAKPIRSTPRFCVADFTSTNFTVADRMDAGIAFASGRILSIAGSLMPALCVVRAARPGESARSCVCFRSETSGLRLSLRSRHCLAHLLHRFPLMLLLILFAPIVAAIAILFGAPARRTAIVAATIELIGAGLLLLQVR